MAIVCQMADGEDWMPGAELQAARKELQEAKEWLAAVRATLRRGHSYTEILYIRQGRAEQM